MVVLHQTLQQTDGLTGLAAVGAALGQGEQIVHVVMRDVEGCRAAPQVDELLHRLGGILRPLHILGLIDEQVGASAIVSD